MGTPMAQTVPPSRPILRHSQWLKTAPFQLAHDNFHSTPDVDEVIGTIREAEGSWVVQRHCSGL